MIQITLTVYFMGLIISWMLTEAHELTCRTYESRTKKQRLLRIFSWPTYLIRSTWKFLKEAAKGE